jgi:hypothetical protein
MATTYTLIDKTTLGSSQASIEFISIDSSYTDIQLVYSARCSDTSNNWNVTYVKFNTDTTSSNYPTRWIYAYSTTTGSGTANQWAGYLPNGNKTADTFGNTSIYIPNYAGSNYKSYSVDSVTESNSSTLVPSQLTAGLWQSTAAINKITLTTDTGSFVANSSFYLYGIKNS